MTREASEDPRNSYLVADLDVKVALVVRLLASFEGRAQHYPGDLCLRGFALHACENANAVLFLSRETKFEGAAFACARAAFEAGQDALLLATEPDYDAVGARVLVFERLQIADNDREFKRLYGEPREEPYAAAAARLNKATSSLGSWHSLPCQAKNRVARQGVQSKSQSVEFIYHRPDCGNQSLTSCLEENTESACQSDPKLPRVLSSQSVI